MPQVYGWYNLNGKSFLRGWGNGSKPVKKKYKVSKSTCKDCYDFKTEGCFGNKTKICKLFRTWDDVYSQEKE